MIVSRPILLALCWVAGCVGGGAAAAAEPCEPTAIIEAYRQAEAAYQAKDFATASAQFRPLAEQGLGPAQLRLGELIQAGDKPDLTQAYHWIALAADAHAPGASAALTKVTQQIGPTQLALNRFTPSMWRPEQPWSCLAADPRVTRPDGKRDYDFARVINHPPISSPTTAPAHREWLAMSLETTRTQMPRYLIYLKALGGMGFISGPGPFVTSKTIGDLPFVQVNESFMGKFSAKEPGPLLNAVLLAVHATLMPGTFVNVNALAHLTETYKG
jgi:hypothetical protein